MNGIRVKSCELTPGQTTIDISDLDSGFYIVQFDVNGKITSKKLVIE
jgi:multisubunit Na+/H+ antiporter MnhE subunit